MLKLIQHILLTMIWSALATAIVLFITKKPTPVIGIIDTMAIIEPIKREVINSVLNPEASENKENLEKITKRLNEIVDELGNKGITLIEKRAIVTKGMLHDYTQEIQRRLEK